MSVTTKNRPRQATGIAAAAVGVVVLISLWFGLRSDPAPRLVGFASLTVDGTVYDFELATCAMPGTDFLASGHGADGEVDYWLSASGATIELVGGTSSEVDQPIEGEVWLISDDPIEWLTTESGTVRAEASFRDRRVPGFTPLHGLLDVRCDTA